MRWCTCIEGKAQDELWDWIYACFTLRLDLVLVYREVG
jgi:hypothetical protein